MNRCVFNFIYQIPSEILSSSSHFQISAEEKSSLRRELIDSSYGVSGITVEQQDFYKVSSFDVEITLL